jgi:hypothetical protein
MLSAAPSSDAETGVESEASASNGQTPSHEASTSTGTALSTNAAIADENAAQLAEGSAKAKIESIIGKINNLITTDINEIQYSYLLLNIRGSSHLFVLTLVT